jgi:hypothetical protein
MMQVNTIHYDPIMTNLMLDYLMSGICDMANVRHAARQGGTILCYYVGNYVDVVVDALEGEYGDKGKGPQLRAALVSAGLATVDWTALAKTIIEREG